jgi:hypothetical protein
MLLDEQKEELTRAFARKNRDAAKEEIATIWGQLEEQSKALEAAEQRAGDLDRMSKRVEDEHAAELKALRVTLAAEHAAALESERTLHASALATRDADAEAARVRHNAVLATRDARAEESIEQIKGEHAISVAKLCAKLDAEAERMCNEAVGAALARHASSAAAAATPSPPSQSAPPPPPPPPETPRTSPAGGVAEIARMRREMRELREMSLSLATTLAEERRLRSGSLARLRGEAEAAAAAAAAASAREQARTSTEWHERQTEEYERRLGDVLATSLANQRAQINAQHARELEAMRSDAVDDADATQQPHEPQWPDAWRPLPPQRVSQAQLQQPQDRVARSASPVQYSYEGAASSQRQMAPPPSSLSPSSPLQMWLQRDEPPAAWPSAQTPVPPMPPPEPAQQFTRPHAWQPSDYGALGAEASSESAYPAQQGYARVQPRVRVRRTGSIYVNV